MVACGTWAATEAPQVQGRTSGPIIACSSISKYTIWTEKLNLQGCRNLKGTCLAEVHYSRTLADNMWNEQKSKTSKLGTVGPTCLATPLHSPHPNISMLRAAVWVEMNPQEMGC